MSTDLTTTPSAAELEKQDAELSQQALGNIDRTSLKLPMIVITQQLTAEVTDREIESGRWLNKVTGEDFGEDIEFVPAYYYKGRFYSPKDEERTYNADGPVAPDNWPDEFAGKNFADIPQAEEQHKAQANAEGGEWGSGPAIQTTHNFIGYLTQYPGIPVRISLKSTSSSAAEKINNIALFAGSYWSNVFNLSVAGRRNKKDQPYFVCTVRKGDQTDNDQRALAREIAYHAGHSRYELDGDAAAVEADAPAAKPKPEKPAGAADVV